MIAIPNATITRHGIAARADFTFSDVFLVPADLNLAMKLQCRWFSLDQAADLHGEFGGVMYQRRSERRREPGVFEQTLA